MRQKCSGILCVPVLVGTASAIKLIVGIRGIGGIGGIEGI
jgi:hypothetical protein